jgi:hypothetical protein
MKFQDIPQFTGWGNYAVDQSWFFWTARGGTLFINSIMKR